MKTLITDFLQKFNHISEQIKLLATDSNALDKSRKSIKQEAIKKIAKHTRELASAAHFAKHHIDYSGENDPEHYDHHCDLYWQFANGNCHWAERAVYSNTAIKANNEVLELCCGDGFYSEHFFSRKAKSVTSADFDPNAISSAKENFGSNKKIDFVLADIRNDWSTLPFKKIYDNVVWDAAIEHFTLDEINFILKNIKSVLGHNGVLSGQTIKDNGIHKQLEQHEYEFKSKKELADLLGLFFNNVLVFETVHKDRHNFYFFASDSKLPMQQGSDSCHWNVK